MISRQLIKQFQIHLTPFFAPINRLYFYIEKYMSKTPSVRWLLRRRVSIIQTDVSDGMVYLMKLKQTMKMAQGTLEGAAQNFERLSVKTLGGDLFFFLVTIQFFTTIK